MTFPASWRTSRAARRIGAVGLAVAALVPATGAAQAAPAASVPAAPAVASSTTGATRAVAPAAAPVTRTTDVKLTNPYPAKDRLAKGWTVVHKATAGPVVSCVDPSISGWTRNTYGCTPTAFFAVACWGKTGYRNVVTCVVDPHRRKLAEYRTAAPLRPTALAPTSVRRPVGSVLASGAQCRLTTGAAVRIPDRVVAWAGCDDRAQTRLWQKSDGTQQYRVVGRTIQYRAATEDTTTPIRWTPVRYRYWLG